MTAVTLGRQQVTPGARQPGPIGPCQNCPVPVEPGPPDRLPPGNRLPRPFFERDVSMVAQDLLGRVVVSRQSDRPVAVRLTEVEAYRGREDSASHAFRGPTPRTAVMFGPAGHLYTYFVYGMHWCANIVTGPDGYPSAVLLRAGEVVDGIDLARARRPQGGIGPAAGPRPGRTRNGARLRRLQQRGGPVPTRQYDLGARRLAGTSGCDPDRPPRWCGYRRRLAAAVLDRRRPDSFRVPGLDAASGPSPAYRRQGAPGRTELGRRARWQDDQRE